MLAGGELSRAEISQRLGLSRGQSLALLRQMVEEGRLEATAPPTSRSRRYRLPKMP